MNPIDAAAVRVAARNKIIREAHQKFAALPPDMQDGLMQGIADAEAQARFILKGGGDIDYSLFC